MRRSETTNNRLADAMALLNALKNWITTEMPNNEPAQQSINEQKNALEQLTTRLDDIRQPLVEEVRNENVLLLKQAELGQQLAGLENQAFQATEPSTCKAIQENLGPVQSELEQLYQLVQLAPNKLVQHGDLLNLPAVDERIKHLEQILAHAEDERKARAEQMLLQRLADQIAQENKKVGDCLSRVQAVEVDPHSTIPDLQSAIDLLEVANGQLGALDNLYNQLDPNNEQQNAIRTQAVTAQAELGDELKNTHQGLKDRLEK